MLKCNKIIWLPSIFRFSFLSETPYEKCISTEVAMDSPGTHTTLDIKHRAKINNTHTHTQKKEKFVKREIVLILFQMKKKIKNSFKRFIILLAVLKAWCHQI
jgi:hypothetical protein